MRAMARLTFFIGKGGVGKTTVSASYAAYTARQQPRRRVLLMSTDPAHSLADVLQQKLGDQPTAVRLGPGTRLWAWEINASKEFARFLKRQRGALLELIESATIFTAAEIEPLLDATLPGMAEVAALVALHRLAARGDYDEIVVDTAPIGHTLRLFQLPEHLARFLHFLQTAAGRDRVLAETFAHTTIAVPPVVTQWERMVAEVRQALSAGQAELVLVTTPENFSLQESVRVRRELAASAPTMDIARIVLNRAVVAAGRKCNHCLARVRAARAARTFLAREFPKLPIVIGEDPGGPMLGPKSLAEFGRHVFQGGKLPAAPGPTRAPEVRLTAAPWPSPDVPLAFTLGKGGVGKTTISAALAFRQRQRRKSIPVVLCSTDPAPSLDDVFEAEIADQPHAVLGDPKFQAVEADAVAEFARWSAGVRRQIGAALTAETRGGVHVDLSYERRVLEALLDVVPPGVDELFAAFRILDLVRSGKQFIIIDMAPTGHALELLRTPARMEGWARLLLKTLAPHRRLPLVRDLAVEIAAVEQRARELGRMLRDPRQVSVWPIMLAEPLPDRETARLLGALHGMHAPSGPLVVNRVLLPESVRNCRRCQSARRWQMATLASLRSRHHGRDLLVVAEAPGEVAGKRRLQAFTRRLWQVD
ncbi:MAG TPA: ArsA family ATPase [Terriglobales bacterium]|nr:ArsA family ATPase [Terriglobales bacterium]